MEKKESKKKKFGLIGKHISYSFSQDYFTKKFEALDLLNYSYENFDLEKISEFKEQVLAKEDLKGLNVTIPYKEKILNYLDLLDKKAEKIGAVNTIKFTKKGLKGYNTDAYGFKKSLAPLLTKKHKKALILGTGGASKAVAFVLHELNISYKFVSRNPLKNEFSYQDLDEDIFLNYSIIVNCTPIGTYPNVEEKPAIPYEFITSNHVMFDLIYNPEKTAFLHEGELKGASISNGYKMLEFQAEKAWEIWNK